jgi:hypothetical protein
MTGKLPKLELKWFFLNRRQKCSSIIVLKQPINQFRLLSQKMPKIAILYGQNEKV